MSALMIAAALGAPTSRRALMSPPLPATSRGPHGPRLRGDEDHLPRRRDDGAVLVEFALVLPLLVSLLLGIVGVGRVLNQNLSVTQAGREGARYGATVSLDQCTPASNCDGKNWSQLVQEVTAQRSDGTVTTGNICVALVQGPGSAPVPLGAGYSTAPGNGPCYVDGSSDTGRRVQVRITRDTEVETGFLTFPVTLETEALSRFEG